MNTAIQCIILLAVCTSATTMRCWCVKTHKAINPSLVTDIKEYNPRPYCDKKEVIVTLKDNSLRCLDPNGRFTQILLERKRMQRVKHAAKKNTTSPSTASATAHSTGRSN